MTNTRTNQPMLELNDGRKIPQLGFGTYKIENADAADIVRGAINMGYPLVDTAALYKNEKGVGEGLGDNKDIWLTTKIWNDDQGYDATLRAFDQSIKRLGRDAIDLLLIHWPCPDKGLYTETWKAFVELRKQGRAKSIGVSNFMEEHLTEIIDATGVTPAVNQIELHPAFQQRGMRKCHDELGIVTQCWSPLGQGKNLDQDVITDIADETGASAAQVMLRWHLNHGLAPIPKASSDDHAKDNFGALEVKLTDKQMAQIDNLDSEDGRMGPHPMDV